MIQLQNKEIEVRFVEMPECEHCGVHSTFGAELDDGICWCVDCANANGYLTEEEYQMLHEEQRQEEKAYLKKQYLAKFGKNS